MALIAVTEEGVGGWVGVGEEVLLSLKQGGHCRQPLFESGQIGYIGDGNQYLKVRYYYLRVTYI